MIKILQRLSFRDVEDSKIFAKDLNFYLYFACRLTEYFFPFFKILRKDSEIVESRSGIHIE